MRSTIKGTKHTQAIHDVVCSPHNVTLPHEEPHLDQALGDLLRVLPPLEVGARHRHRLVAAHHVPAQKSAKAGLSPL